MATLKRYNEVATRFHKIGDRKINEGDVTRVVSISERDAEINNSQEEEHGFKYVLEEEKTKAKAADKKPTVVEKTDKEIRVDLFAKAEELGLTPPKNIKTENLEKQIAEAEDK